MKPGVLLAVLGFSLFIIGCSSSVREKKELEGYWALEEVYSSGISQKPAEGAHIIFEGDGTYKAILNAESGEMTGQWTIKSSVMKLWQPEITDLHGDRSIEPYASTWQMSLGGNWLILEGLPTHHVQHLKLVLHKRE